MIKKSPGSVVLLSAEGSPLLAPFLQELKKRGVRVAGVLIDGALRAEDQERIRSRLEPHFKIPSLWELRDPEIPFYFIHDHNSADSLQIIERLQPTYLLNAGTPRILKNSLLSHGPQVINGHPGLLPKYRGCTCVEWAIFNDDPVGVTAHFMDEKIDRGPIILQKTMPISSKESYEAIRTRIVTFTAEVVASATLQALQQNLGPDRLPAQPEGMYFKPISDDKLALVKEKLSRGGYEC